MWLHCNSWVLISKHKPQFQELLNETGTPFINGRSRTHPSQSPAPPTFFHQCVTWFPLNDDKWPYRTSVTTYYEERAENWFVVSFRHSPSLIAELGDIMQQRHCSFRASYRGHCPVRKPCLLSQHLFTTHKGKQPVERIYFRQRRNLL